MTKKAIITTHDGREATIVTKASNVLFEDGQTAQDILNDRQDTMITPEITNSSSMFKVGQGDSVDYSENVVDGAYESCVLKGNTKVNLIQEPSSKDVVLPYEFTEGQSVTINDTKESGALGVELKGQTLVNLQPKGSSWTGDTGVMWYNESIPNSLFKPNTKYFLKFNSDLSNILESCYLGACRPVYNHKIYSSISGCYAIMTTNEAPDGGVLHVYPKSGIELNNTVLNENVRFVFIEYQEGMENWDIPYFEGMKSVEAPSVTTVGKNLFDGDNHMEFGAWDGNGDSVGTPSEIRCRNNYTPFPKELKNGDIMYIVLSDTSINSDTNMHVYDGNKTLICTLGYGTNPYIEGTNFVNGVATITIHDVSKCKYFSFRAVSTNANCKFAIMVNTSAPYEDHKSTTLTLPEEITLRGIGNVKDTLNTVTGEYTQRIGEVVLDGSDDETIGKASDYGFADYVNSEYSAFRVSSSSMTNKHHELNDQKNIIKTDKFNVIASWLIHQGTPQEGITNYHDTAITISILKSKLTENTVAGFKQYLQQNPITVQYRLATPITKKLDLTFTDQDNAPTAKLSTYNTTTRINASSQEGSLIPTLSHVNPSYPVILKPSTKYSIVADSSSNDHTNSPINFNLGGATVSTTVGTRVATVTTPSTLTSDKLVMSGRGNKLNNVMVIEGDVVGDEPYFEGMCDVKSYVTLENLLNNVDKSLGHWGMLQRLENVKTNTTYTLFNYKSNVKVAIFKDSTSEAIVNYTYGSYTFNTGSTSVIRVYILEENDNSSIPLPEEYWKVVLLEGDYTDWDIPYFEGTTNFQRPMITTTGKNLWSGVLEWGDISKGVNSNSSKSIIRSQGYCSVLPNTTYTITVFNGEVTYSTLQVSELDENFNFVQSGTSTFTTSDRTKYIRFRFRKSDITLTYTQEELKALRCSVVESSESLTTYEPYKTNILSCNSEVVLRSLPNGVCDTLDLMIGEYVQRIGEVILDGSATLQQYHTHSINSNLRYIVGRISQPCKLQGNYNFNTCISDFTNTYYGFRHLLEGDWGEGLALNGGYFAITLDNGKLPEDNLNGVKTYLQQNPITLQYELATPITTTIDLQGSPYAYKDGHIQLTSGSIEQSLTPIIEYSVPTNRNGQIRSNQKMVEKHQKELDKLQAIILANLVNSQYNQTLTTLNYELSRV